MQIRQSMLLFGEIRQIATIFVQIQIHITWNFVTALNGRCRFLMSIFKEVSF